MKRTPLLVFTLLFVPGLAAQKNRMTFLELPSDLGLANVWVTAITQDQHGFMWFATQEGISRYDGRNSKKFRHNPDDPTTLSENSVFCLLVDRENVLWVGTYGGGLNRFDRQRETFKRYRYHPKISGNLTDRFVLSLLEDSQGTFWVGTQDGGLCRYARNSDWFEPFRHDPRDPTTINSNAVNALFEDSMGHFWIGTRKGLQKFDTARGTVVPINFNGPGAASLTGSSVQSIDEDASQNLWAATYYHGVFRVNLLTKEVHHFSHAADEPDSIGKNIVRGVLHDRSGVLWFGTFGGGLNRFDQQTESFTRFSHNPIQPKSLADNRVTALFEDRTGILWLGSQTKGVVYSLPESRNFEHYNYDPQDKGSLSNNRVGIIYEDREETLWVGTSKLGLNRFDKNTKSFERYTPERTFPDRVGMEDRIRSIMEDRRGFLWLGSHRNGLARLDKKTYQFKNYRADPKDPDSLAHNAVRTMLVDRSGALWIGTLGGGLERYNPKTDSFVHHRFDPSNDNSLSKNRVSALLEDPQGNIWIGTLRGGINKLSPDRQHFTRYRHRPGDRSSLSNDTVTCLLQEESGRLWAGTFHGLNVMQPASGTFRSFKEMDGLTHNRIHSILEDKKGYLWLSTYGGLCRFDKRNETFDTFDLLDGLPDLETFNGILASSKDGQFYYGGNKGFVAFNPLEIEIRNPIPPVAIVDLYLSNKRVQLGDSQLQYPLTRTIDESDTLQLSHQESLFSLELAALDFASPSRHAFSYRLKGFDRDWIDTDYRNPRATYSNVPPGTYLFQVTGRNRTGERGPLEKSLEITIVPPFWRTWWAGTIAAILLISIVLYRLYAYRRKLEKNASQALQDALAKQQSQKMESLGRLAGGISHDFNAILQSILGFNALAQMDPRSEYLLSHLNEVQSAGEKGKALVDQILAFCRQKKPPYSTLNLAAEVEKGLKLARVHFPPEIKVTQEINPDAGYTVGNASQIQQVLLNLCLNAIQAIQPKAGEVLVSLQPNNKTGSPGQLVLTVSDSGRGMSQETIDQVFEPFFSMDRGESGTGLGLAVVHGIVTGMNGTIEVKSRENQGATFQLSFPRVSAENANIIPDQPQPPVLGQGEHIVWIDDDLQFLHLVKSLLLKLNYRVTLFQGKSEALSYLERNHSSCDLMILDLHMRGTPVAKMSAAIKGWDPNLPILLCTGSLADNNGQEFLAMGFRMVLTKPVTVSALSTAIKKHLRKPN